MDKKELANFIIDELGGTSSVARWCDIEPPSVSEWRKKGIPHPWLRWIKCAKPELYKLGQSQWIASDGKIIP